MLCQVCLNAEASCECERFTPSTTTNAPWTPSRVGAPADQERLLEEVRPNRRPHLERFLREMRATGCSFEHPVGKRDDYVNMRPPTGYEDSAVCVITRSTGRIQFRPDSYALAREIGQAERFDALEADKAAIDLEQDADVDAAIAVARAMLAARRASG